VCQSASVPKMNTLSLKKRKRALPSLFDFMCDLEADASEDEMQAISECAYDICQFATRRATELNVHTDLLFCELLIRLHLHVYGRRTEIATDPALCDDSSLHSTKNKK